MTQECKHQNFDSEGFCEDCGKKFTTDDTVSTDRPTVSSEGPAYECPHCRFRSRELTAICEHCGNTLPETLEPISVQSGEIDEHNAALPSEQQEVDLAETATVTASVKENVLDSLWSLTVQVDPTIYESQPDELKGQFPCPVDREPVTYVMEDNVNALVVGRASAGVQPDIAIDDPFVSRNLLNIVRTEVDGLVLRPLKDSNPILINGNPAEVHVKTGLKAGDNITLGGWTRIAVARTSRGI